LIGGAQVRYWGIGIVLFLFISVPLWAQNIDDVLLDESMQRLLYGMKDSVKRQTIIAHNIANKDTPGYKPIRFAEELSEMMSRPGFDPQNDTVIEEEEMAKMTKNRFKHSTYIRLMNVKLEVLKKIVNQGR
jgi:flagellar basal body rod protein FlgB